MSLWNRLSIILLFVLFSGSLNAQIVDKKLDALNTYVHFSNECVHGLLIIHRLLENFNQDINKYVDLESHQINFYSNKDLPKNIFLDEEHWFYEESPTELYTKIKNQSKNLNPQDRQKLNLSADRLMKICNELNNIRFEIEDYINQNDLSQTGKVEAVYKKLENCVRWYDNFYKEQRILLSNLRESYASHFGSSNKEYSDIYGRLHFIHKTSESIFKGLREKNLVGFDGYIKELNKHFKSFQQLKTYKSSNYALKGRKFTSTKSKIESKVEQLSNAASFFFGDGSVPPEYKLYGKFYYYHNSDLINKFNRYGNGFVTDMNTLIEIAKMPVLIFAEMPHFYQVIYPEKLDKDDHIISSDPDIELLPTKLRDRNVVTNTRKIMVDSASLEVKIFDHKIQDGDIISLNFNGDWILEKQNIENKPMSLKLRLNKEGKNYLLLHAENLGRQPPNTLGLSYYHKGERKEIILESDLNASEMIEIEIDN